MTRTLIITAHVEHLTEINIDFSQYNQIICADGGLQIASLAMGQMTSSLGLPIGVFYIILPLSGALNIIYTILNIVDIATDSEVVEGEV